MFIAPLQHTTVTKLPQWMTIAYAVSAKFKAIFISGKLKLIPLFPIPCLLTLKQCLLRPITFYVYSKNSVGVASSCFHEPLQWVSLPVEYAPRQHVMVTMNTPVHLG